MKIEDTMVTANKIWKLLKPIVRKIKSEGSADLKAYRNGRENGYQLVLLSKNLYWTTITWSENKNSDDCVVYVDYCLAEGITEEAYKNRKLFYPPEKAVKYIEEMINEFLESERCV